MDDDKSSSEGHCTGMLIQATTRGSCIPASRGYGQVGVCGLRLFCFWFCFFGKPTKRNGMATDGRRISLCCCHAAAEDPGKDGFYEITPTLMQCNAT